MTANISDMEQLSDDDKRKLVEAAKQQDAINTALRMSSVLAKRVAAYHLGLVDGGIGEEHATWLSERFQYMLFYGEKYLTAIAANERDDDE